jgi:phosphoserine phosphatase/class 3 adenylate cyclase
MRQTKIKRHNRLEKNTAILFADLVGSTLIKYTQDVEFVHRRVQTHNGLTVNIVTQHGGTIPKILGDAVIGLFSGKDSVERAVKSAIGIQREIEHLEKTTQDNALHFQTRIVIGCGDIEWVRYEGGMEDMISLTLDGMAYVSKQCEPGEILFMGSSVPSILDDNLRLRFHPWTFRHLSLKGSKQELRVYPINWRTQNPGLMRYFWRPSANDTRAEFVNETAELLHWAATHSHTYKSNRNIFGITRSGRFPVNVIKELIACKGDWTIRLLVANENLTLSEDNRQILLHTGVRFRKLDSGNGTVKLAMIQGEQALFAVEILSPKKEPEEYPWVTIRHNEGTKLIEDGFSLWWKKSIPLFSEKRYAFIDLDGVIFKDPHYLSFAKVCASPDVYKKLEKQYKHFFSKTETDDAMLKKMALYSKGWTIKKLKDVLSKADFDIGIVSLIQFLVSRHFHIVIVTHGLREAAKIAAERLKTEHDVEVFRVCGNSLQWSNGVSTGKLAKIDVRAGVGKMQAVQQVMQKEAVEPRTCIAIGDGHNDLGMFMAVGGCQLFYQHGQSASKPQHETLIEFSNPVDVIEVLCERFEMLSPIVEEVKNLMRRPNNDA